MKMTFTVQLKVQVIAASRKEAIEIARQTNGFWTSFEGYPHGEENYLFPRRVPTGYRLEIAPFQSGLDQEDEGRLADCDIFGFAVPREVEKLSLNFKENGKEDLLKIPPGSLWWSENKKMWTPLDFSNLDWIVECNPEKEDRYEDVHFHIDEDGFLCGEAEEAYLELIALKEQIAEAICNPDATISKFLAGEELPDM